MSNMKTIGDLLRFSFCVQNRTEYYPVDCRERVSYTVHMKDDSYIVDKDVSGTMKQTIGQCSSEEEAEELVLDDFRRWRGK